MAPTNPPPAAAKPTRSKPSASKPSPTTPSTAPAPKKRKRTNPSELLKKSKQQKQQQPHILHQSTHRNPPWLHLHLRLTLPTLLPSAPQTANTNNDLDLDILTTHTLLTTPLTTYLGLIGSAIPMDILRISGLDVYIRVPREDGKAVRAGLSSWVGGVEVGTVPGMVEAGMEGDKWGRVRCCWRVVGEGGGVLRGNGADLFG